MLIKLLPCSLLIFDHLIKQASTETNLHPPRKYFLKNWGENGKIEHHESSFSSLLHNFTQKLIYFSQKIIDLIYKKLFSKRGGMIFNKYTPLKTLQQR